MNSSAPGSLTGSITLHAGDQAGVVHVAAECAGVIAAIASLRAGATRDAPEHRLQRQLEWRWRDARGSRRDDALRLVDVPDHPFRRPDRRALAIAAGSARVRRQQAAGIAGRAIRFDLREADDQHVAGLGAFDVEGSGLRIAARRHRLAVPVRAAGINGLGDHTIARLDAQRRRMRKRIGRVELGRCEVKGLRRLRPERRRRGRHDHGDEPPPSNHVHSPPLMNGGGTGALVAPGRAPGDGMNGPLGLRFHDGGRESSAGWISAPWVADAGVGIFGRAGRRRSPPQNPRDKRFQEREHVRRRLVIKV